MGYIAMPMRTLRLPLAALVSAAALLSVPSAIAENQSVRATESNTFTPSKTAVKPGETVTFTNAGGEHNVVWNDNGVPANPSEAVTPDKWPPGGVTRTFTKTGAYRYYCKLHGDPRVNFGMVGFVYVNAAGQVPPSVSGLRASGKTTKATLKFRSSRAGRAKATFFRKSGRKFTRGGASTFSVRAGQTTRVVRRAFAKGSWRVEVVVTDANKLASDKKTATFKVS